MRYLYVVGASFISILLLFFLTKLIGKRQMSQLSMFDYIVGITIGSVAAELATGIEDIISPVIAMVVYSAVTIAFALLSNKFLGARKLLEGKSTLLYKDGKVYYDNMKKSRVDMNEILMQARIAGYFDLSKVSVILLESNGQMSFLPLATDRPVTPSDMALVVPNDCLQINVVIDGQIITDSLALAGKNKKWLENELKKQNINNLADVVLASVGTDGNATFVKKKQGA